MGKYKDEEVVVKFMRDSIVPINPSNGPSIVAQNTKLNEERARRAIDLGISSNFIELPKETGENYTLSQAGILYLKKRFHLFDHFLASYESLHSVLSIIAIIISIIALVFSVFIK